MCARFVDTQQHCKPSVCLQKSVSTQPRTSLPKSYIKESGELLNGSVKGHQLVQSAHAFGMSVVGHTQYVHGLHPSPAGLSRSGCQCSGYLTPVDRNGCRFFRWEVSLAGADSVSRILSTNPSSLTSYRTKENDRLSERAVLLVELDLASTNPSAQ